MWILKPWSHDHEKLIISNILDSIKYKLLSYPTVDCGWLRNPAPVIRGLHVLTILLVVQDLVHPYVKILSSHLVNQHSDIHHLQKENQWTGHVTVNDLRATLKKMDVHTENLNVPQRFFTNFAVKVAQNCIPKWHGIVRRNHHLSATIQPDLKSWPMCPQAPQTGDVPIGVCTDLILWSATFWGDFDD